MEVTPAIGMNVSIIVLLFIAGVVLAGIVLLVALLANRQTRGVGLASLGLVMLFVFLAFAGLFVGYSRTELRHAEVQRHASMAQMQAAQAQALAQADEQMAESYQAVQSANPPSAPMPPLPQEIGEFRVVEPPVPSFAQAPAQTFQHSVSPTWFGVLVLSAAMLVVLALLLARGHRVAVLGALGTVALVGLLGIVWLPTARPMMSAASIERLPAPSAGAWLSADAWDFATAPRIAIDETPVEAPQPEAQPPTVDEADAADEADTDKSTSSVEATETPAETETPATEAVAPPARPDWLDDAPQQVGNVYRRVLSAGPYATHDECHADMRQQIERATLDYVADQSGLRAAQSLIELGVMPGYLLSECVSNQYYEPRDMSGGYRMWTQYVQLEFDAASTDYLLAQNRAVLRGERVTNVALAGGGVLGTLALVLGLLRLDTATKGYYTKRLFIGVPLAIIGALGLLAIVS